jgi:hypothetical protein
MITSETLSLHYVPQLKNRCSTSTLTVYNRRNLSTPHSYRFRVTALIGQAAVVVGSSLVSEDLGAIGEIHTDSHFWQLAMTIETAPTFLRRFDKLEDHDERGAISTDGPSTGPCGGARLRTCFQWGSWFASASGAQQGSRESQQHMLRYSAAFPYLTW